MMNRTALMSLTVIAAGAMIGIAPIQAQDANADQTDTRREAARLPSVETVMSLRERLSLTDDQVARLESIRAETVERRSAEQAEMAEMRSLLAAGQIQRSEMMAFMEDRQAASGDLRAEHRARLGGVLDEAQLETLQEAGRRGRSVSRGRAGIRGARDGVRRGRASVRGGRQGVRRGQQSLRGGRGFRGARDSAWSGRGTRGPNTPGWDRSTRRFRGGR